ncbi:MAG: tyrosine-type recombinase/integrase, partial [Pirellulales bacterium]
RGRIYQADGRSNQPPAGRHSLGTAEYAEARRNLDQLDRVEAVNLGLADSSILPEHDTPLLTLEEGVQLYFAYVRRPSVAGGCRDSTARRYRPVFNKFTAFAKAKGILHWNHVRENLLTAYATWLNDKNRAYRTQYFELTTLKQSLNWLIREGHLPEGCRPVLPLQRAHGTTRHCWRPEEVTAMVELCRAQPGLNWLGDVLVGLACTGMRISELAQLRWSDIDRKGNMIRLADESTHGNRSDGKKARTIKNHRSRSFPIATELRAVLDRLADSGPGPVFRDPDGTQIKDSEVRRVLSEEVIAKLADRFPTLPGETGFAQGCLHSFRHYFCSTCANSGTPERAVMRWLGHQHSEMVQLYYHLHDEEAQRQMQKLSFVSRPAGDVMPGPNSNVA